MIDVVDDEGKEKKTPTLVKTKPPPMIREDTSCSCNVGTKKKICSDCSTSINSKCNKNVHHVRRG